MTRSTPTRALSIAAAVLALHGAPATAQCGPPDEQGPRLRDSLLVSTRWLAEHLRDTNLVILHVDHMGDGYARGHIPGARRLDAMAVTTMEDFNLRTPATIDSVAGALGIGADSRVVVYGDPWVTGMVFVALDQRGYGNRTALLDGGIDQWRAEGRPVSTQAVTPVRRAFAARPRAGVVVDGPWVRAHAAESGIVVIDARTTEEYTGAMTHGDPGGHVPGARLVPWLDTFVSPDDAEHSRGSRLKPAAELRALFQRAGVQEGVTPVLYCTVGMRASHMYFVLRYLGYDPKFYDGSMNDWNRRHYPLATGTARGTP